MPDLYTHDPSVFGDDPTREEAVSIAQHLAARFPGNAPIPEGVPTRLTVEIVAALGRITDGTTTDVTADAKQAMDLMDGLRGTAYHQLIGDLANDLMPAAALLLRTATQAAVPGSCRLGGPGPCDGPDRVLVTVHDAFGTETYMGCARHVASECRRWDHGGEVELTLAGEREPVTRVLGRLDGVWPNRPVPRWTGPIPDASTQP